MTRLAPRLGLALLLLLAAAAVRPGGEARPGPVAGVALGGFNGLLADLFWLRATQQQDAGQFHALAQTGEWIAALQPQTAGLYEFQAQNLAYNVAGQFDDGPTRWSWIQAGLRLLTDEGRRRNPDDPRLDLAIATILTGKLVDSVDPWADEYRRRWAEQVGGAAGSVIDAAGGQEIEACDGPFDWRAPEPYVVYWCRQALTKAGGARRLPRAERTLYQALALAVQQGRVVYQPGRRVLERVPELRVLPAADAEFAAAAHELPGDEGVRAARWQFVAAAVLTLYVYGDRAEAAERYRQAQRDWPRQPELRVPVEAFVLREAGLESLTDRAAVIGFVDNTLLRAGRLVDAGDDQAAAKVEAFARWVYDLSPAQELPAFDVLERRALQACRAQADETGQANLDRVLRELTWRER